MPLQPTTSGRTRMLFVCVHLTLMDPVVLYTVLRCRIPVLTYSTSTFSEIPSPILVYEKIKQELAKGDLIVLPEGTPCRQPFLLRFIPLFAEIGCLVAMNYQVGFFHVTMARGWKGLDPIFFFMNPRPVYEITFLNQLPADTTCSAEKSPYNVATYMQRILVVTLGFECSNFMRKDSTGFWPGRRTISYTSTMDRIKKAVGTLRPRSSSSSSIY